MDRGLVAPKTRPYGIPSPFRPLPLLLAPRGYIVTEGLVRDGDAVLAYRHTRLSKHPQHLHELCEDKEDKKVNGTLYSGPRPPGLPLQISVPGLGLVLVYPHFIAISISTATWAHDRAQR